MIHIMKYKKLWFTLILIVPYLVAIYYFSSTLFQYEFAVWSSVFVAFVIYFYIFIARVILARKAMIYEIRKFGEKISDTPLKSNEGWIKGVGYSGQLSQPFGVKYVNSGIAIFFYADRGKGAIHLNWEAIERITLGKDNIEYAVVSVIGLKFDLVIPYDSSYMSIFPDTVKLFRVEG